MRGNSIGSQTPQGSMTIAQLMAYTGMSRATIDRWVKAGWLDCDRVQRGQLNVRLFNTAQQHRAMRLARSSRSRRPLQERHKQTRTYSNGTPRASLTTLVSRT